MTDTDKYEGNTVEDMTFSQAGERLWFLENPHAHNASDCMIMNKETLDLIMDAPNLLAEVKRLREGIKNVVEQLTHPISYGYNDVNNEEHIDNLKELIKDGQ